jgi:hypothetical protein
MAMTKTVTKRKVTAKKAVVEKKETAKKTEDEIVRENTLKYSANEKIEYLNLAEMISIIYEKEYWAKWGFTSFEDFGEKELKRSYRTMRNLSVVGDMLIRTKLPVNDAIRVDKSILSNIASFAEAEKLVKEEITALIEETENLSFEQAKEVIKARRIKDAIPTKTVKLQLKFTEEQYTSLEPIIKEAQETFNTGGNISLAIEHALMVWGSNRIPEQDNLIAQYVKEKGLDKSPESSKVSKRKAPSHKGKKSVQVQGV